MGALIGALTGGDEQGHEFQLDVDLTKADIATGTNITCCSCGSNINQTARVNNTRLTFNEESGKWEKEKDEGILDKISALFKKCCFCHKGEAEKEREKKRKASAEVLRRECEVNYGETALNATEAGIGNNLDTIGRKHQALTIQKFKRIVWQARQFKKDEESMNQLIQNMHHFYIYYRKQELSKKTEEFEECPSDEKLLKIKGLKLKDIKVVDQTGKSPFSGERIHDILVILPFVKNVEIKEINILIGFIKHQLIQKDIKELQADEIDHWIAEALHWRKLSLKEPTTALPKIDQGLDSTLRTASKVDHLPPRTAFSLHQAMLKKSNLL